MGCDIHAYVEYSRDGEYWLSLTDNAGHRDYQMFGIMAGVRREELMLFQPRGMPAGRLGCAASGDYWINVAPEAHPEWADDDGWVSRGKAELWVEGGFSIADRDNDDDVLKRVSDPDWHTHSWLNADEISQCVDRYRSLPGEAKAPSEWVGIAAAMKAIEVNGDIARVIFWFDN